MIKKIVSGGQAGADRAALDAAINLGIPHGGWVPKGRLAEDGPLPAKYQLDEMPTKSYAKRTEQNIIDSDSTLIVARGKLTRGTALTKSMAKKHGKSLLLIDLDKTRGTLVSPIIVDWMVEYDIEVLNVAGPRASKDPKIYDGVKRVIEGLFHLWTVRLMMNYGISKTPSLPDTVQAAVDEILGTLSLAEQVKIANMSERELAPLKLGLIAYVQKKIDSCGINRTLKADCIRISGEKLDEVGASTVIIDQVWERLKKTHRLRVVKYP